VFTRNFRSTLSLHKTICPLPSGVNLGQVQISPVLGMRPGREKPLSDVPFIRDLTQTGVITSLYNWELLRYVSATHVF